jgi:8-oxo-dGTP pyrophosphatase MutT (NUDIX family)
VTPPHPLATDIRQLLTTWPAPDAQQDAVRHQMLAHLAHHPAALWYDAYGGHFTASTLVADPSRNAVLLTLHPKVNAWIMLGGHHEPDDITAAETALREAIEESGIPDLVLDPTPVDLDVHPLNCPDGHPGQHLDIRFLASAPPGAIETITSESLDLRWFPLDDLPPLTPATTRLINRAAERLASSVSRRG